MMITMTSKMITNLTATIVVTTVRSGLSINIHVVICTLLFLRYCCQSCHSTTLLTATSGSSSTLILVTTMASTTAATTMIACKSRSTIHQPRNEFTFAQLGPSSAVKFLVGSETSSPLNIIRFVWFPPPRPLLPLPRPP